MHYLLFYDVVDDYVTKRAPFRWAHLDKIRGAHERGELVMAGALTEPADGAVIVFRTQEAAEAFAKVDPYVANGLVSSWKVRKWVTVAGDGATMPTPGAS